MRNANPRYLYVGDPVPVVLRMVAANVGARSIPIE